MSSVCLSVADASNSPLPFSLAACDPPPAKMTPILTVHDEAAEGTDAPTDAKLTPITASVITPTSATLRARCDFILVPLRALYADIRTPYMATAQVVPVVAHHTRVGMVGLSLERRPPP